MSQPEGATSRILVVDNDPIFSGLARAALGFAGFDVQAAGDGVEGLQLLDRQRFDLVIVDLVMPKIDGLRLIALVRGAVRLRHVAIMVVSARHDAEAFREAMALGADTIEAKPLDWSMLPGRARAIIAKRRSLLATLHPGVTLKAAGPAPSTRAG